MADKSATDKPPIQSATTSSQPFAGDPSRASDAAPKIDPPKRAADTPDTAASRLRAYEDEMFGKRAVRINDKIERGSGSPFSRMNAGQRGQYDALEKLVEAEQKLADANSALSAAQNEFDAAEKNVVDATERAKVAADAKARADAEAQADAKSEKPPLVA